MNNLVSENAYLDRLVQMIAGYFDSSDSSLIIMGPQLSGKTVLLRRLYETYVVGGMAYLSSCPAKLAPALMDAFSADIRSQEIAIVFADEWGNPDRFTDLWRLKAQSSFRLVCTAHNFNKVTLQTIWYVLGLRQKSCRVFRIPSLQRVEKLEVFHTIFSDRDNVNANFVADLIDKYSPDYIGEFIIYCYCVKRAMMADLRFQEKDFVTIEEMYLEHRNLILAQKRLSLAANYILKVYGKEIQRSFEKRQDML